MSCSSRVSTFSTHDRMSDNFRNVNNALKDLSYSSEFGGVDNNLGSPEGVSEEQRTSSAFDRLKRSFGRKDSSTKRRSSYMPSPLQRIREEHGDKENLACSLNTPANGPRFSSTPSSTTIKAMADAAEKTEINLSSEIIDVDALNSSEVAVLDVPKNRTSSVDTIVQQGSTFSFDFKKEFEALHEKIHYEVQSSALDANMKHLEMMSYIWNQNRELKGKIQMVEECMAILMSDDHKISRIMELQQENQELRVLLDQTLKKSNQ